MSNSDLLSEMHGLRTERARERALRNPSVFDLGIGSIKLCEIPGLALGSVVWDCAIALARFLVREKMAADRNLPGAHVSISGQSIVELGSGTGLPALVAACLLGADAALLTEKDDEHLELLRMNVASSETDMPSPPRLFVRQLDWTAGGYVKQLWTTFCSEPCALVVCTFVGVVLCGELERSRVHGGDYCAHVPSSSNIHVAGKLLLR